jgi:hypothetical protein
MFGTPMGFLWVPIPMGCLELLQLTGMFEGTPMWSLGIPQWGIGGYNGYVTSGVASSISGGGIYSYIRIHRP